MHKRQVDLGHTWRESTHEAQAPPAYTQPIWDLVGSWVRDKGVWFGGGEKGGNLFLGLLPKLFWEVRPAGMADHPKEARLRKELLGACHEG